MLPNYQAFALYRIAFFGSVKTVHMYFILFWLQIESLSWHSLRVCECCAPKFAR